MIKILNHLNVVLELEQRTSSSSQAIIRKLLARIPPDTSGFLRKSGAEKFLRANMFDDRTGEMSRLEFQSVHYPINELMSCIESGIRQATTILPTKEPTIVHVVPTFQEFIRTHMRGVHGYTPYRNVFYLFLHPRRPQKRIFFREVAATVVHEYNHSIRFDHVDPNASFSLLDSLIFEGLAERFQVEVTKQRRSIVTNTIDRKAASMLLVRIAPHLTSKSKKLYREVFFGSIEFPLWTGYAIGYHIVSEFRKRHQRLIWTEIIRLSSAELLKGSRFLEYVP
ncbi:MAG: DUF2268 domain-containing putative Zn-dependent protease [bacterium]|nr:DUF2268 domain-containing putative Zn-dependent protease [bacterium]